MTRFRSSTDRDERIDGTASILRETILEERVAKMWDDDINADGEGLTGAEVADALDPKSGTRAGRALRLLTRIEARVTKRACELALDEAAALVDGRNEE